MTGRTPKALPAIDPARCTGCGWCVAVCAPHVLSLQVQAGDGDHAPPAVWGRKRSVLHDAPACTGCALCAVRCPFGAIAMVRLPGAADTVSAARTGGFVPQGPAAVRDEIADGGQGTAHRATPHAPHTGGGALVVRRPSTDQGEPHV